MTCVNDLVLAAMIAGDIGCVLLYVLFLIYVRVKNRERNLWR